MALNIDNQLAKTHEARACLHCVEHSDLCYYKSNPTPEDSLLEMILQKQIYVATGPDEACVGFMGMIHQGCFRKFSYLSLIAVKKEHRRKGVGKLLLDKFETLGFEKSDRVFLLVSDLNGKSQQFYHRSGYQKVGTIPDLFKEMIFEHLMVKNKNESTA